MSIEKIIASIPKLSNEDRRKMRDNAIERSESADGSQREEAQRVLAALESQERTERAALLEKLQALTPEERVVSAFTVEPMTDTEKQLIRVLLENPGSSSAMLTEKLGWNAQSWHLHFGTMCANRAAYLWPAPPAGVRQGKFYSGILADLKEPENLFTMKPNVAAAFIKLGVTAQLK